MKVRPCPAMSAVRRVVRGALNSFISVPLEGPDAAARNPVLQALEQFGHRTGFESVHDPIVDRRLLERDIVPAPPLLGARPWPVADLEREGAVRIDLRPKHRL